MYRNIVMFLFGGILYGLIEVIWRGYTHWSMVVAGGVCFLIINQINKRLAGRASYFTKCVFAALAVTAVEFIAGVVVNLWLGLGVWDYSKMPMNLLGQVCLPFCLMWLGLMLIAVWLERALRFRMFSEVYEN